MEGGICRILGYSSPSILSKCTVLRNTTEQEFINKRGRPNGPGTPCKAVTKSLRETHGCFSRARPGSTFSLSLWSDRVGFKVFCQGWGLPVSSLPGDRSDPSNWTGRKMPLNTRDHGGQPCNPQRETPHACFSPGKKQPLLKGQLQCAAGSL